MNEREPEDSIKDFIIYLVEIVIVAVLIAAVFGLIARWLR